MLDDRTQNDLLLLFSEYAEGRLSEEQEKELVELLRCSPEARALYVKHRKLEAMLRRRFGRFHFTEEEPVSMPAPAASTPQVPAITIEQDSTTPTESTDIICDLSEIDPEQAWGIAPLANEETSGEEDTTPPILAFLGDIFKSGSSFLGRNMTLLILLLPILAIVTVIWMSPTLWKTPNNGWQIVARVRQSADCVWKDGCKRFEGGDFLLADQTLNLQSGLIELEFYSGAKVILQGPARFVTENNNAGQLDFGRLTATVPDRAKGFLVDTPAIDVTDLGTEFGLFVNTNRNSDVHVFKGEVRVDTELGTNPKQQKRITQNHAINFNSQTGTLKSRPADPHQFICNMQQLSQPLSFVIEHHVILKFPKNLRYTQARATLLPHKDDQLPEILLITQEAGSQSRDYRNLVQIQSDHMGFSWTKPQILPSLKRKVINSKGDEQVIGDFWPKLHKASGMVLGTGKIFTFIRGNPRNERLESGRVSYSVYDHQSKRWNGMKILQLPEKDHQGFPITEPNAGSVQRVDLPDGDILLPFRYQRGEEEARTGKEERRITATVARCSFDGKELKYKEHGSEFTLDIKRGLQEPSLTYFKGRYYLTLRGDESAFVAQSNDGINYEPIREWTFDDGTVLGSYNTQQHWVTHSDSLFLVYTRRGANNDHIARHRAPLFIAQVDPKQLCVIRSTEQVLIPENNAMMGNFGVTDISPLETWVTVGENLIRSHPFDSGHVIVAKIYWSKPNKAIQP